jgi:hypothetical protein
VNVDRCAVWFHQLSGARTARLNLKALRVEEYVCKVLAEAPPLTDEQRTRLAELLKPVRVSGGAAG